MLERFALWCLELSVTDYNPSEHAPPLVTITTAQAIPLDGKYRVKILTIKCQRLHFFRLDCRTYNCKERFCILPKKATTEWINQSTFIYIAPYNNQRLTKVLHNSKSRSHITQDSNNCCWVRFLYPSIYIFCVYVGNCSLKV